MNIPDFNECRIIGKEVDGIKETQFSDLCAMNFKAKAGC